MQKINVEEELLIAGYYPANDPLTAKYDTPVKTVIFTDQDNEDAHSKALSYIFSHTKHGNAPAPASGKRYPYVLINQKGVIESGHIYLRDDERVRVGVGDTTYIPS